jgi:hypothetical protein
VTVRLKKSTLIRKNTHAFTAKEKPKLRAMYSSCEGSLGVPAVLVLLAGVARSATRVPEKAKKRKRVVPANSAWWPRHGVEAIDCKSSLLEEVGTTNIIVDPT